MEEILEINNLAGLFQCIVKDCKVISEMQFCWKILALKLNAANTGNDKVNLKLWIVWNAAL